MLICSHAGYIVHRTRFIRYYTIADAMQLADGGPAAANAAVYDHELEA